ncbi:4-hydroxybenzoate polyprenyltransferase [Dokdonia sp. Hel_I_53]|nr:4-hydroxybenzoate polyprenyltransferase [Dokdonia sp. Hel_I_53]
MTQGVLHISFNYLQRASGSIIHTDFIVLTLSTLFIAAGGYVINDFFDIKADRINKPDELYITKDISKSKALLFYCCLTFVGISLGVLLCYSVGVPVYSLLFFAIAILLYIYSFFLQRIALVGNLVISILIGFSLYIIFLIETIKTDMSEIAAAFTFMVVLAIFINFIREIIKDIQDMKGDYSMGYQTLPILLGIKRTLTICTFICLALVFNSALFAFISFRGCYIAMALILFGVSLPLAYLSSLCFNATTASELKKLARLLKLTMLMGIILIPFIIYFYTNA